MSDLRPMALIVDADATIRRLCRAVLDDLGFAIQEIDTGVAAITAVRNRIPDLIILGRQLRDVTGREVGQWIQSMPALHTTPVIVLPKGTGAAFTLPKMTFAMYMQEQLSPGSLRRSLRDIQPLNR